jgi:GT2 family glycosyltransferase
MPNTNTKVSVIVVNFNGMPYLETCLSSILNQNYRDFEVILVDNCSGDGSLDYVRQKFPDLPIVANEENLGYAGGINSGMAHASGRYIAPINIDTEVGEIWLAPMVRFLNENLQVGAVTPKILLYDDSSKVNAVGMNIHVSGLSFARALGKESKYYSGDPVRVAGVSGCSFLVRRELLDRLGGLNERFFMYCDDTEFSWAVNLMAYEIYCVPEAVVYHKYKLEMNPEKFFFLEKNRQAMLLSSLEPLTFVALFPIFAATELLTIGYCLLKGRSYLQAKFEGLRSLYKDRKYIKERRTQVQKIRRISDFQLLKKLKWNLEWDQLVHISK